MAKLDHQSSFMKSLFMGEIREDLIFPYPSIPADTVETINLMLDALGKFSKEHVRSAEWDEKGEMPRGIVSYISEMGLMGLAVPEEYGGLGLSQSGYARVTQEVSSIDSSLSVTMGAHQSIGYKALLLFGSKEQKEKYLPRLATGQLIASYCLTEPGSGSDAASIKSRAILSEDGKHFILNGNKLWITNGGIASFMTIFAQTEIEENGEKKDKVTCFVLELPVKGVSVGPPEHKMGIRASCTNAIHFDNVKIPVENVVHGLGKGFKVAMGVLNHGRLGLAAGSIGVMNNCLKASIAHANQRVQFKKKLREFGMIKEKIARMSVNLYAAESMVYMTTSLIDKKEIDYSVESALAKIFATERSWEAIDETIQIWGGNGFMKEYPFERWMRDTRINRIFEGTNEILRAFVALSGMQSPGQQLSGLAEAIKYPLQGLGFVTDFAIKRIKRNILGESITRAHPALKREAGMLEEHVIQFSSQVEGLLRRHGKSIFLKQMAQKRVADIALELYGMFCVLSRVTAQLEKQSAEKCQLELAMAEAFCRQSNRRVKGHFSSIDRNEDELLHLISDQVCELEKYPFDSLKN